MTKNLLALGEMISSLGTMEDNLSLSGTSNGEGFSSASNNAEIENAVIAADDYGITLSCSQSYEENYISPTQFNFDVDDCVTA